MNILMIYDSKFGNTQKIAQAMALALGDYGAVRLVAVDKADAFSLVNATDLHLLVIGGPTQIHGISPAMKAFLDSIPTDALRGLPTLCFDTRYDSAPWMTGAAGRGIARHLLDKGAQLVAQPQSFFVVRAEGPLQPGELNRAAEWVRGVITKLIVSR